VFAPLWHGWPLTPEDREPTYRARKPLSRERALMDAISGDGCWTYVAISPCERYAKIGRSGNPVVRVREGFAFRAVERRLGIGRVYLVRAYGLDIERECHDLLAPDQVHREWFRVGPRFRVLIARLDREFGPPADTREAFLLAHAGRIPNPQQHAA
jgi:hypothetical protein